MRKHTTFVCADGAAFDNRKEAAHHDLEVAIPNKLEAMFQIWLEGEAIHKYANHRARAAAFIIQERESIKALLNEYDESDIIVNGDH